jgi:hypothetical protein
MSITVNAGSKATHTVAVPQPNAYALSTAKIYIKDSRGKPIVTRMPVSFTKTSLTFEFEITTRQHAAFYNCGACSSMAGDYQVMLFEGAQALDPPQKVIEKGSFNVTGSPPCGDCGGDDPEPPPPPPGGGSGGDSPYGAEPQSDEFVPPPPPPGSVCLPPSFVAPPPGVPTPCE